ncbi:MAG: thiamine phosphate synthase [Chloroflexota bacterium]|nr:MAG: thiamine phosphate synthase [Chloroflexota bacterium]
MPRQTLRILDANCNRIGEGLRFLEDVARFLLNDAALSHKLKTMRHNLIKSLSKFGAAMLSERDSEADVGFGTRLSQQQDLPSLVVANAKRVEEALRVVEELAKLRDLNEILHSEDFEQARFSLYTLEKELLSGLMRRQKTQILTGLYVIVDTQTLGQRDVIDAASKAINGGAKVIQLRDKQHGKSELLVLAKKLKDLCCKSGALFIVNDYLDIALASEADGIHIGYDDLPLSAVRKELPIDKIIGLSTHTLIEAQEAETDGADYIAVGSIFASPTKVSAEVVGLEHLRQVREVVSIPIVAIGGINKENIGEVIAAGADSAAVISAVLTQKDIESATHQLVKEIEKKTKSYKKSGSHR